MPILKKTKAELFKKILSQTIPFGIEDEHEGLLPFLMKIWDLKNLPSEDPRYKDAYGDIYQHTINNHDWDLDYLFVERLSLFEDENAFVKFLEAIVSPEIRKDEDEIITYVLLINSYIEKDGEILSISEYTEDGQSIYKIRTKPNNEFPIDLPSNEIPFFVVKKPKARSNIFSSHSSPQERPSFVLVFNSGWNDHGHSTEFELYYYETNHIVQIGAVKITNGDDSVTANVIPNKFTNLSNDYCSLGQSYEFYEKLKKETGRYFESVLFALKDAAFFIDIRDKFERNIIFSESLIREDRIERLLRVLKHKIYGFDLNNLYKFKYSFKPLYSEDSIDFDFDFDFNLCKTLPNRIYAIIGKNGVGKTQLITTLPINIAEKKQSFFSPRAPLFSKVIAVSYSIFDNFKKPQKTSSFNYFYCGILNDNEQPLNPEEKVVRFHETWTRIILLKRQMQWKKILLNFIDEEIVDSLIKDNENLDDSSSQVHIDRYHKIKDKLSSGQNIILFIISEIISHIRFDSILLFDEPETHLHPNAIRQLINTIYELVEEFESYCIITTHSPVIIQELFSKNVYILEKHENFPSARKIGIESFGENLTVLTEEVFGNKEIPKHYKKIIDSLFKINLSYKEIVEELSNNDIPLSLNAKLYIKSQFKK